MNLKTVLRPLALLSTLLFFTETTTAQQRLQIAQAQNQSALQQAPKQKALQQAQNQSAQQDATQSEATSADNHQNPNASPFDAVQGKKEAVEKRDAFSKHYVNEDGSYTALIGAGPIHYEKNGAFLDIDHNITRSNDANFPYANTANLFESYFGVNAHTGVKSKTTEGEVTEFVNTHMYWEVNGTAVNTTVSANTALTIDGNKATFNNMYGNIAAEFDVLTGKRELNYVIPTQADLGNIPANADYLVFVEDVILPQGWRATESDNGIVITDTRGTDVYLYENPRSTDAGEMLARENNTVFEMTQNQNVVTIATKVKTDWLLSNDRQYPVKVDPTVNAYANGGRSVFNTNAYNADEGTFGRDNDGWSAYWLQYHIRFNLAGIPNGSTINAVSGYINIYALGGTTNSNNLWHWSTSIDPTIYSGLTLYNSANSRLSNSISVSSNHGGWNNISFLTGTPLTYIEQGIANGNISAAVRPDGTYNPENFYAARPSNHQEKPYLSITYTEPVTDRTLTVSGAYTGATYPNGSHTFPNNTQVTATSGTRAGYTVTGWTGTGSVPATGSTGSATFTITQNSSIAWQWEQTGTPKDVVFHNYGGDDQLAFNNSRMATDTPTFRLSHTATQYDATAYEVEINTSPNFTGTSATQEFSLNNPVNTEANVTFNSNFTPTDGATYYVRARVKGDANVWSAWTTETYSFTYSTEHDVPDWYQTEKAQFKTGDLSGVIADNNHDVIIAGGGGNQIVNGDFSNGLNGWSTFKSYNVAVNQVVGSNNGCSNCSPAPYNFKMGYDWATNSVLTSDYIILAQKVDLTNVDKITFDTGRYRSFGGIGTATNSAVYFKIGGELNNETGTTLHTSSINANGSFNDGTITINTESYSGIQTIKFVFKTLGNWDSNTTAYFYVSNVKAEAPPAGTITSTPIHLASVQDATGYEGLTWNQTLGGDDLTLKVQGSTNGVTFTDISGYTAISESGDGEKTFDLSGIDASAYPHIRLVGTLDGTGVKLHDWSIAFDAPEPVQPYDFIYINDTELWDPYYPGAQGPNGEPKSDHTNTILVMEGTATFTTDVEGLTLTVLEDANLNVEKVLKLNGNLTNDGHITFVNSSIDDTAQFAEFNHDILGDGLVTTERFIPAKRSFRFLTPTVNTTTTIRENWQENGSNDPYWGTHITGNGGATNGFDPTGTNNWSMFTYSNDAAQTWNAVPNTNALTLNAGTPYRIMVRGDRTADLTNNDAVGNDTRLRATGKLVTGDFNVLDNNNNLTDGDYIFVANPYQAKVDLYELLASSSNVGQAFYYLWEPGLSSVNGRGAYTTFDFSIGEPITTGATATHQIQPGQAIFLVASGSNPSLLFKEGQKRTSGGFSTTFRSTTARIKMSLFYQESFDDNDTASDGIMIKFAEDGNNDVDQYDAHKLGNLDENLAVVNNDTRLSIESRDLPTHEEILPLFINNYRKTDYVLAGEFKFIPERTTAYLYDNYTDTYTEILTDGFEYRFSVDPAIEASISSKRFDVRFSVDPLLGIDDDQMTAVTVYPNPFSSDNFTIAAKGMEGQQLQVNIVNMLGQQIYNNTLTVSENGTVVVKLADAIASGVYHVNIVSENQQSVSKKLIKN